MIKLEEHIPEELFLEFMFLLNRFIFMNPEDQAKFLENIYNSNINSEIMNLMVENLKDK